jgi:hypothetical protein
VETLFHLYLFQSDSILQEILHVPTMDLLNMHLSLNFFFLHMISYLLLKSVHQISHNYVVTYSQKALLFYQDQSTLYLYLQTISYFVLNFDLILLILFIKNDDAMIECYLDFWGENYVFDEVFILI